MRIKATLRNKETITISEHAASVLAALVELEKAGLIENGSSTLLVDGGYDEGSLETTASSCVTHKGREFVEKMA